jgi:hypothetical protein
VSTIAEQYLAGTRAEFARLKDAADRALAQVDDDDYFRALDAETNSLAVIVKHMAGNLRSRWTDLLTSDGEKPDRDRDGEFVIGPADSRAALAAAWESGWRTLFDALDALDAEDVGAVVHVRGERLTLVEATQRQLAHAANHVGQIILMARHFRGADWLTLTVPRGDSRAYTASLRAAARAADDSAARASDLDGPQR